MKIGIVGYGYVGQAVASSYNKEELIIHDTSSEAMTRAQTAGLKFVNDIQGLEGCDAIFVCVSTPSNLDRSCNSDALWECVSKAESLTLAVISKSTAPVSHYRCFSPSVVYVPEFLRQAHFLEDYAEQREILLGVDPSCPSEVYDRVVQVLRHAKHKQDIPFKTLDRSTAVFVKYAHNVSLAVKVAAMNELAELAEAQGIAWSDVSAGLENTNAGGSHTQVPGPDGKRGIGGACFPKDLHALLAELKLVSSRKGWFITSDVLRATTYWLRND